jgi:hypothetical protein
MRRDKEQPSPQQKLLNKRVHLRWAVRIGLAGLAVVSVWANALHAWGTGPVGIFINMLPPTLVLVGFEFGSRIPIAMNAPWYRRWPRPAATTVVSGIGAYLSYFHQRDAFAIHADMSTARLLPVSIDGLMVILAVSLYELNDRIERIETLMQADANRGEVMIDDSVPTKGPRRENKREKVLAYLARDPQLTAKDLAKLAGVSVTYASILRKELLPATNGSELVTVE